MGLSFIKFKWWWYNSGLTARYTTMAWYYQRTCN